jgi:hypothetical protein
MSKLLLGWNKSVQMFSFISFMQHVLAFPFYTGKLYKGGKMASGRKGMAMGHNVGTLSKTPLVQEMKRSGGFKYDESVCLTVMPEEGWGKAGKPPGTTYGDWLGGGCVLTGDEPPKGDEKDEDKDEPPTTGQPTAQPTSSSLSPEEILLLAKAVNNAKDLNAKADLNPPSPPPPMQPNPTPSPPTASSSFSQFGKNFAGVRGFLALIFLFHVC